VKWAQLLCLLVVSELFGVVLNVVQGLAASKAKHATKLALAAANSNLRNAGMIIDSSDADSKKDVKSGNSDAAAAAADDDAGWDAAVAAGSASQAAVAANESADDSVSLVTTIAALLPGANGAGAGTVHSAAEINAFMDELLRTLGNSYAASGKAGSKSIRPVTDLQKEEELLLSTLSLFERVIEVDSERVLGVHHPSSEFFLQAYLFALSGGTASVALKKSALNFIHWLVRKSPVTGQPYAITDPVLKQINGLITCPPFPAKSHDLEKDSAVWHQYTGTYKSILLSCSAAALPIVSFMLYCCCGGGIARDRFVGEFVTCGCIE
jgi:hypothetical protein